MKRIDINQAVDLIKDGMTIMVGGFLGVGAPNDIIKAIVKSGKKDLTIICNDTAFPECGSGLFVANRLAKKIIASHIGTNPIAGDMMLNGEIEIELVPQGTLIEQIRCGGSGLGGVLTPTGLGTMVEKGKQIVNVDGKDFLLEKPLRADVALVGASITDSYGNLVFRGTTKNFNPLIAMAADIVIAQATEEVEKLEPHEIHTPYLFIDYLVKQ
ncbi:MAG: 3-oxoacid CoA-transferase subunit A [Bacteroidia bacterium]|nr:3-oxoacid CoA-transferase subunit A [Bacteroidia bacterium]